MPFYNAMKGKKYFALLAVAVALFGAGQVLADSGPVTMNVNPQGLVTAKTVKLTMDTKDLARCRYSEEDVDYDEMEDMETPDGLYHFVSLGELSDGSYAYYARCMDFMGEVNDKSAEFVFKAGDLTSGGCSSDSDCSSGKVCKSGSCIAPSASGCSSDSDCSSGKVCKSGSCIAPSGDMTAPVISSPVPSGTIYESYVTLSVSTNEAATCRTSWYDKTYDSMTITFDSSNRYSHTAPAQLSQYGYYTYYIRCKDDAGNVNAVPGKISFRYASRTPITTTTTTTTTPPPVKDTTAPVISSLSPSGDVKEATTTIACTTDEKATCKYDTKDGEYDAMANLMDASETGKSFSKSVTLDKAGSYSYYIRCKDQAGNKSTSSSQIGFTYVVPVVEGPKISNVQPKGTVLMKNIALILQTDKAADCRYSTEDVAYADMGEEFSTNDGLLQQATLVLEDFGPYTYYVRCADKSGNESDEAEIINFTYKDANASDDEEVATTAKCEQDGDCKDGKVCEDGTCKDKKAVAAPACDKGIATPDKDGACDKIADCICDPDCQSSQGDVDPDCANVKPADNGWIVILLIGVVLIVVIVIIIAIIKKRGSDEEDVELP